MLHICVEQNVYVAYCINIERKQAFLEQHPPFVLKKTPYCYVYTHVKQQVHGSLMIAWNAYRIDLGKPIYVYRCSILFVSSYISN